MSLQFLRLVSVLSFLVLAACGSPAGSELPNSNIEDDGVTQTRSEIITSCYDWNGTCTGLPEGAGCGNNGTCVADTYGVSGWCSCWEQPVQQPSCPGGGVCGGSAYYSSCAKSGGGWGSCYPIQSPIGNWISSCWCL